MNLFLHTSEKAFRCTV